MGLNTTIFAAPDDRDWVASAEFIRKLASLFRVSSFQALWVSQETIPLGDPELLDEDRYDRILELSNVTIDEGLQQHRAGYGFQTWIMFPPEGLLGDLNAEIRDRIPSSLSDGFVPIDAAIYNGRWSIVSYDEGTITQAGSFAVTLSGYGCPTSWDQYLEQFMAVEGVRKLKSELEAITGQPFSFMMELT